MVINLKNLALVRCKKKLEAKCELKIVTTESDPDKTSPQEL